MQNSNKENRKIISSILKHHQDGGTSPVISSLKKKLLYFKKSKLISKILTKKERTIVKLLITTIIAATVILSINWYLKNSIIMPDIGGEYIEGIIGSPSLINPILAQNYEVDKDIAKLLFNGLLKQGKNAITNDLSASYSLSKDQLTYTFQLKQDVYWHDGSPFTADDVIFTVQSIQNLEFKSPLYNSLKGVLIQKIDNQTVKFKLSEPFSPFLSLLTFGILPKHLWEDIPPTTAHLADLNIKNPIGTGPFKIKSFKKDSRGVIKNYTLTRNEDYYNQPPKIKTIILKFYPDFLSAVEALNNNNIDSISYLPNKYQAEITNKNTGIKSLSLPQYTAIFFNQQNNEALKDLKIRQALILALNRQELVSQALENQGKVIYGPILPGFIGFNADIKKFDFDPDEARKLIESSEWKRLSIILTTVDNQETVEAASLIKKQWEQAGIKVDLNIVSRDQLMPEIIKPRMYQALLLGQNIGNDPDPYAFWHSSQINDPGVNLSMYSNKKVDALLEEARKTSDIKERGEKYIEFQNIIQEDLPALFLYTPTYPYILNNRVKNFNVKKISIPADRFNGIEQWYIETKRVFE
ncbi:MAG: ABC transporter substrate-binding protein [Patescibacteria group bacterium]